MAKKNILMTGGAGFIGSHLATALLAKGNFVRGPDKLTPQVHGEEAERPAYFDPRIELCIGDIRDGATIERALSDIDAVFLLAAPIGAGQSMCEVEHHTCAHRAKLVDSILVSAAPSLEAAS